MSARVRKLIGLFVILGFMFAYIVAAITLADHVPAHRAVQLIYFVVVGSAWFVPLIPLMKWMNRGH